MPGQLVLDDLGGLPAQQHGTQVKDNGFRGGFREQGEIPYQAYSEGKAFV